MEKDKEDTQKKIVAKKPGNAKNQIIINPPEKVDLNRGQNEAFQQALHKHTVILEKKTELVLQSKATFAELPEDAVRQVYARGYKSLPLNSDLTRQQFAMNAVNSFIAGGAAMAENYDLLPITERLHTRLGLKGSGGGMRPHIKREKSPYNGRTVFHVVDAKGAIKHSTSDEMEAKKHLATKYNTYMGEMTLSPTKRFEATNSLVKTYKKDTPGQVAEGKMSELDIDMQDMKDKDFETHYGKPKSEYAPKKKPEPATKPKPTDVKEEKDEREYGYEGDMAISQLKSIGRNAEHLLGMMKPETDLPEWVQSKITLAQDYMQTAHDYMTTEMTEQVEQIDELKSSTLTSYIDKVATGPSRGKTQTGVLKSIKAIGGVTKAIRKKTENAMKEETLSEVSKDTLHRYMVAGHKKYDEIEHKKDPASMARKAKLEKGIKQAYNKKYPKVQSKPEPKDDMSPGGYYASKKPGQYTGD